MADKIRVLLAKPGLDGHDRGIKIIAAAFRDAGFEVIYTGLRQTPEQIVSAAIQEDVDAVGVSILSGAHMTLFPAILNLLKEQGGKSILLFGGGIIPGSEERELLEMGVAKLYTPGATTTEIIDWLKEAVAADKTEDKLL